MKQAVLFLMVGFLLQCGKTEVAGDIALIENQNVIADRLLLAEVAQAFYAKHADDYDMLVLWGGPEMGPGHAYYLPIQNDVTGIGYKNVGSEFFDTSAEFGSRRLQGLIWMGPDWITNPEEASDPESVLGILAQETAHRWAATIHFQAADQKDGSSDGLLGDPFHWSFFLDTGASPLGGNDWEETGDSVFEAKPVDAVAFSSLDLYLMGLVPADDVGPILLLENAQAQDSLSSAGLSAISHRVTHSMTVTAQGREIFIQDIIAIEGLRDPAVGFSAKEIRQAWIYVGPPGISSSPLQKLKRMQTQWEDFFSEATGGLSVISSHLNP